MSSDNQGGQKLTTELSLFVEMPPHQQRLGLFRIAGVYQVTIAMHLGEVEQTREHKLEEARGEQVILTRKPSVRRSNPY